MTSGSGKGRVGERMRRVDRDAQRSLTTRTRLLEAALDVLVERGYAGFSTVAVCERAQAPRGTLLHHYPNRDALVVASLDHVLGRRLEGFRDAFDQHLQRATASGESRLAPRELLDMLWAELQGPANIAWLELVVASRTNPELRRELVAVVQRFDAGVRETFATIAPPKPGTEAVQELVVRLVFAALNGLSLDRAYRDDLPAEPVIAALAGVAGMLAAGGARPSKT